MFPNLSNLDWSCIIADYDACPNTKFNNFVTKLKEEIGKVTIKSKVSAKWKLRKCWITRGIVNSINIKNELYRQSLLNPEIKKTYLDYKKQLNSVVKEAKRLYFTEQIANIRPGDSRTFWKVTNSILNKNTNTTQTYHHIDPDYTTVADNFNLHFSTIGERIHASIGQTPNVCIQKEPITNSCALFDITENEIIAVINSLKPKKSSVDGISNTILKQNAHSLAKPLMLLFNEV